MQNLISVIVPIYNCENYINQCVDSILAQTCTNFELLLIDDGSSDNSGIICDEYAKKDARVKVFHKENGGVSSARNLGLHEAKGEWIAFVDADDWIKDTYLSDFRIGEKDVDIHICGVKYFGAETNSVLPEEDLIIINEDIDNKFDQLLVKNIC
jgi:Glycosyltransferases involved in cell wall biogenesis